MRWSRQARRASCAGRRSPARSRPLASSPTRASQKMRDNARRTSGRVAARPDSSKGNASTYCRTDTEGITQSTKCAARPAILRPAQLGHRPRSLHEHATAMSWRHERGTARERSRAKSPHTRGSLETPPPRTSATGLVRLPRMTQEVREVLGHRCSRTVPKTGRNGTSPCSYQPGVELEEGEDLPRGVAHGHRAALPQCHEPRVRAERPRHVVGSSFARSAKRRRPWIVRGGSPTGFASERLFGLSALRPLPTDS